MKRVMVNRARVNSATVVIIFESVAIYGVTTNASRLYVYIQVRQP